MKTGRMVFLLVALLSSSVLGGQQTEDSADRQLKAAMHAELVDGNLRAAIDAYKRIVSRYAGNRAIVARALLQLGGCYEKLGQADARKTYEQLLREYADQAEAAGHARARLAALTRNTPETPVRTGMAVRSLPYVQVGNDLESISPDGTKAAILDYSIGQNLAVYDFTTKQSKLLTHFDWSTSWVISAVWSPDGREIAYMQAGFKADSIAELRTIRLTGETRTVFRNTAVPGGGVSPAGWLPDGKAILCTLQRPDKTSAMGVMSLADGAFTQLRSFPWGVSPRGSLSPDGRWVAFVERTGGNGDIHVLSIDGARSYRITDNPADDTQPRWSPDGKYLAFLSNRLAGDALWAVAVDGGSARGEAFKIKDGMQATQLVDWSPRGIVALQRIQTNDLYTIPMDPATSRPTAPAQPLPYSRTGRNFSAQWSPDGQTLAFISSPMSDPRSRYVVVMPKAGRAREFLIPTTQYPWVNVPYDLRWFGNGRGVGFSGIDERGEATMFRLALDSGEWKTFPLPVKTWTRTEWNVDGTKFYYGRQGFADSNVGVFERDVETGRERRIYEPPPGLVSIRSLGFGLDRKWLAFMMTTTEKENATAHIVTLNVESGESRILVSMPGQSLSGMVALTLSGWSPDGRVLVQRTTRPGGAVEWLLYPVDGAAPTTLAIDIPPAPAASGAPGSTPLAKWSPDGTSIVFERIVRNQGAFLIENPLAELPRPTGSAARR